MKEKEGTAHVNGTVVSIRAAKRNTSKIKAAVELPSVEME